MLPCHPDLLNLCQRSARDAVRSPAPIQTLAPSSLLAAAPVSSRGDPLLLGSFTGTQTEAGAAPLQDCNMDRDTMVTKCSERRGQSRALGDVQLWSKGERGLHHEEWDPAGEEAQIELML